jgi:DNA-binding NarL/FixJ family response regulator
LISHVFMNHIESLLVPQSRERGTNQLTGREVECLTWAARGKSEEGIALVLNRSRQTVHFHLQNAVKKLDAANRTHAVAIACTRGLVSLR